MTEANQNNKAITNEMDGFDEGKEVKDYNFQQRIKNDKILEDNIIAEQKIRTILTKAICLVSLISWGFLLYTISSILKLLEQNLANLQTFSNGHGFLIFLGLTGSLTFIAVFPVYCLIKYYHPKSTNTPLQKDHTEKSVVDTAMDGLTKQSQIVLSRDFIKELKTLISQAF